MKKALLILTACLCATLSFGAAKGDKGVNRFVIEAREIFQSPISPLLYGNFIELGYGRQVEPMCSELFFNRSFERFPKYKDINKLWYDLFYDEVGSNPGFLLGIVKLT